MSTTTSRTLTTLLQQRYPQQVLGAHQFRGQETVLVTREGLVTIARFLKEDPAAACDVLMDLTCVDYLTFGRMPGSAPTLRTPSPLPYSMSPKPVAETWKPLIDHDRYRFEIVYHFYASSQNRRLRVKVPLPTADPTVDSLTGLYHAANWFEREVWDMFGVRFVGHPNLKRLLMYDAFVGHPLRKDYPVNKRQPLIGPVN